MAKQKFKSKPAARTPVVPRYGDLYLHGLYYLGTYDNSFDPVDPDEVALCKQWLEQHVKPRKSINLRGNSSYGWKHRVEHWSETFGPHRYVANGSFIQAAIDLGYKYVQDGPNARFNFGPKRRGLFDWKYQLAPKWSESEAMQAGARK